MILWEEPSPLDWLPVLFVVGNSFFWVYVRRRSWRGPFAGEGAK